MVARGRLGSLAGANLFCATVVIQLLKYVAVRVRPPRALVVPFPHGYPLDSPGDPGSQRRVIEAMLRMLEDSNLTPPSLVEYDPKLA
ncbi:MAG: hypothetical protein H0T86_13220 [Gemmatimonadales bacterium]|nr:hypothetical protein [Gemmatimonadales bacterium]